MKKHMLALLAMAVFATATSVTAAQAGVVTNETVSYAYSGYVPCANGGAGELLTGTIDVHNLVTSTVNGNVETSQFDFQPRGSLVGTITGDTYRLAGVTRGASHEGVENGHYVLTYVSSYLLIGPGPGNNLAVRETAHVTMDGDDVVVQHDDFSIDCS
jgi:hypothetical protein